MWRWVTGLLAVLAILYATFDPALAGGRVALVVGNGTYKHVSALPNPTQDSADMAMALRSIGFEVTELENAGKIALEEALGNFSEAAAGADFAIIYFAGHGIEVDRQNYLIPTDAKLATDRRLRFEAISLDTVLGTLEDVQGIRMVLLDACRNNPFAASMKMTSANRSIGRGFSPVEAAVSGTVISYSARAGTVAADGDGRNSPIAAALLANITKPGLELQFLLREVRDSVLDATRGTQEPFISASLGREAVYLVPPVVSKDTSNGASAKIDPVAADFQLAKEIGTAEAWTAFLATHGKDSSNFYVNLANAVQQKLALNVPVPPKVEPEKTECDDILLASTGGAKKCLKPGDEFTDCEDCPAMVVIPAGSFTMGSPKSEKDRSDDEGPQRKVRIGQAFGVGKFEVTRGQYAAFVADSSRVVSDKCWTFQKTEWKETSGSFRKPGHEQTDEHPAVCVSRDDAQAYVQWLSKKTGITYRLLSEAEWEYAARAGSQGRFSFGDDDSQLCDAGNGADKTAQAKLSKDLTYNTCTDGFVYTAPAGSFAANNFGLNDMHGNVWESTTDCYNDSYRGAPVDGAAWTTGECKYSVIRGGGWVDRPHGLRSADRIKSSPVLRFDFVGFRVARTLTPLISTKASRRR